METVRRRHTMETFRGRKVRLSISLEPDDAGRLEDIQQATGLTTLSAAAGAAFRKYHEALVKAGKIGPKYAETSADADSNSESG